MKIEAKERSQEVDLIDIEEGECFFYNGDYYLMTDDYNDDNLGVVHLAQGTLCQLNRYTKVHPIKAKVVFE